MKSTLECQRHADRCESMAKNSSDDANRGLLFALAAQWRELADTDGRYARMVAASRGVQAKPAVVVAARKRERPAR